MDGMTPYSTRRQIDIHETSKCNKNVQRLTVHGVEGLSLFDSPGLCGADQHFP